MMYNSQVLLNDANGFARVSAMPKDRELEEAGIWNFREVPRDAIVKAKIGAALEGLSVKAYIIKLVETHWQELEKKGMLPKSGPHR
jgi:hypothetical protein